MLAEVQREPDRREDGTATWSLLLPHIGAETIRQILHDEGTGISGRGCGRELAMLCAHAKAAQPQPTKKPVIEGAYKQAEAAGIVQLNEDEAGSFVASGRTSGTPTV